MFGEIFGAEAPPLTSALVSKGMALFCRFSPDIDIAPKFEDSGWCSEDYGSQELCLFH